MRHANLFAVLVTGTGIAISAHAQQPPDVVNSDDCSNTAMGTGALLNYENIAKPCPPYGSNTAAGYQALFSTTTGTLNTAVGSQALFSNLAGPNNTAVGAQALYSNDDGNDNTAIGDQALFVNTDGSNDIAIGSEALRDNTIGWNNTAVGFSSLYGNTTGDENTAVGSQSLFSLTTGSNNIAVGNNAGYNLTTTANNIDIGNEGTSKDGGVIRIGTLGTQTTAHIAGIYGVNIAGGVEVVINKNGQLGVKTSSRRYKEAIRALGDSSEQLYKLRPVAFRYKEPETNGQKPVQYGLIAEEVAKVYPELVIREDDGKIQGVRYDELAPLLLNEVQSQRAQLKEMQRQIAELKKLVTSERVASR